MKAKYFSIIEGGSIHESQNHECIEIHEFTKKFFNFDKFTNDILSFHEHWTNSFLRIHEQFCFHFHQFTNEK